MTPFSPATDNTIECKYSAKTLEHKLQNKTALQSELGWPKEKKVPVLCLPMGMSDELGGELFTKVLPGILSLQMEILILGKGTKDYGELFTELAHDANHRISILKDTDADRRKMYAAADMALFTVDPSGTPDLKHCLQYGVVPVAPTIDSLEDYNPVQESGNSFLYGETNEWHCFAAIVRALETYKFPYDWRTIQKHCME